MGIQECRNALRGLRSAPGFTITAMLSLSLGIGGTVSMFTVVNSIVLRPLAYEDSGRLVRVMNSIPRNISASPGLYALEFRRWRKGVQAFESIGLAGIATNYNLTGSGEPETLAAMRISAGFFDTLKVQPQLGRWFQESDEQRGNPNVVILSDSLWRRRFSRDAGIVGTKIVLNGAPYDVVGVAPSDLKLVRGKATASRNRHAGADRCVCAGAVFDPGRAGRRFYGGLCGHRAAEKRSD